MIATKDSKAEDTGGIGKILDVCFLEVVEFMDTNVGKHVTHRCGEMELLHHVQLKLQWPEPPNVAILTFMKIWNQAS